MRSAVIAVRRRGEARRLAIATTLIAPHATVDVLHVPEDGSAESYQHGRAIVDDAVEHLRLRHHAIGEVEDEAPVLDAIAALPATPEVTLATCGGPSRCGRARRPASTWRRRRRRPTSWRRRSGRCAGAGSRHGDLPRRGERRRRGGRGRPEPGRGPHRGGVAPARTRAGLIGGSTGHGVIHRADRMVLLA